MLNVVVPISSIIDFLNKHENLLKNLHLQFLGMWLAISGIAYDSPFIVMLNVEWSHAKVIEKLVIINIIKVIIGAAKYFSNAMILLNSEYLA